MADAVLCVACGYHLKLGHHLATATGPEPEQHQAADDNPYASPQGAQNYRPRQPNGKAVFDLTEYGAKRAKAIVADADMWLAVWVLSCICGPVWLFLFPWYLYRLYSWYDLHTTFEELRFPNSLSPHGDLAVKFNSAYWRLMTGVVIGAIFWLILALGILREVFTV